MRIIELEQKTRTLANYLCADLFTGNLYFWFLEY